MLKEELTKQHLVELAHDIYMSPGSIFSMLNLILRNAQANLYDTISFNTNQYLSTGILFTENDVT